MKELIIYILIIINYYICTYHYNMGKLGFIITEK